MNAESLPQLENTQMAATRTLMSLLRTGATVAGGGAVVTDLLVKGWPHWVAVSVSVAFLLLGSGMMWGALSRGRKMRRELQLTNPREAFLFPLNQVTIVTVALQLLIGVVLVLHLLR